jgi:hypothetical protein
VESELSIRLSDKIKGAGFNGIKKAQCLISLIRGKKHRQDYADDRHKNHETKYGVNDLHIQGHR